MSIWNSLLGNEYFDELKCYAQNIRMHLKLYPSDKKKLVIDNYKRHGEKVFKIFAEVKRYGNKNN